MASMKNNCGEYRIDADGKEHRREWRDLTITEARIKEMMKTAFSEPMPKYIRVGQRMVKLVGK